MSGRTLWADLVTVGLLGCGLLWLLGWLAWRGRP